MTIWPASVPDEHAFEQELAARAAGYVPGWNPGELGPGRAMTAILAHYLRAVAARLEQAPEKNAFALLDLAGLGPAPPQSARAPMIIRLSKDAVSGTAPAGTPVSAPPPPGQSSPIVFETEQAVGLTAARVAQVASLWPERDQYIDHTGELAAGRPARLFARDLLQPIPHRIYIAHRTLLALSGAVDLAVEIRLARPSAETLWIDWRYWDGEVWRSFLDFPDGTRDAGEDARSDDHSVDGTDGLRRTGVVRLRAACAQSVETAVYGVSGFWIRGSLAEPLLPDPDLAASIDRSTELPAIETIRISAVSVRRFDAQLDVSPMAGRIGGGGVLLAATGSISGMSGRVVNEADEALRGAVVSLRRADADAAVAISQPTGDDGFFQLGLPDAVQAGGYLRVTFSDVVAEIPLPSPLPDAYARSVLTISLKGATPDKAFADGTAIDLSKPFLPFGAQPQPGSTFAFTSAEIFSKPGAEMRIYLPRTKGPQDVAPPSGASAMPHRLAWEYWNGRAWAPLGVAGTQVGQTLDFARSEIVDVVVPDDMEPVSLNDVVARWMRVRIVNGGYGYRQTIVWLGVHEQSNEMTVTVTQPPALAAVAMGYVWQHGPFRPERVLTENDFAFSDRTEETTWPGRSYEPFTPSGDAAPTLYVGLDARPPADVLSLFLDLEEDQLDPVGPSLEWECFDGGGWLRLSAQDETGSLRAPGIVSLLGAERSVATPRFGAPLHWVRARLRRSEAPGAPSLAAIAPNAVWASERRTLRDVAIGSSDGTPGQRFTIAQVPVLADEWIEVRESLGPRARTEWRLIARQLAGIDDIAIAAIGDALNRASPDPDVVYGPLRLRRDAKQQPVEVWVRWTGVASLLAAGPSDRVYALDRLRGRLFFGDCHRGRTPPVGAAILARRLQTGGGSRGNLPARAISQLIGAVAGAEEVYNVKPSEGGSDGESPAAFRRRGPMALAHRGRAVTARDIEALALEASAAVALARVLPLRGANGRSQAGRVTVVIVPASAEARPFPTRGLRQRVRDYVARRASATLGDPEALTVTGPDYAPIGVAATLVPWLFSEAGEVEKAARAALAAFLHPLIGGPDGQGWDLGRGVHLSDVAAVLERVPGLDHARDVALTAAGIPQGESVAVAAGRIVAAGEISFTLEAREV
ncbi:putative baseplate assembly protein [Methylobacterium tarhaniae]|uniref:putative baseplate assembly protein n=1 Tax=Methylobacterium tarhaniae TaxID=1187852 RepID=UPI003D0928E8